MQLQSTAAVQEVPIAMLWAKLLLFLELCRRKQPYTQRNHYDYICGWKRHYYWSLCKWFCSRDHKAQTTITPSNTSGLGTGASFDVTLADGVATVAVRTAGDGYKPNDTFTILGSAIGGTDGVNDLTVSVASLAASSMVSFGSLVSGNRIDTARFSGAVSLISSISFDLTTTNGT